MDREAKLATIDALYRARCKGDVAALAQCFAQGATFEFAGDPSLIAGFPASIPAEAVAAVSGLIALIEMREPERLVSLVDGDRASVLTRVTVAFAGNPAFETRLYDLFEFDGANKVKSFVQYADTAKVVAEMALLATANPD